VLGWRRLGIAVCVLALHGQAARAAAGPISAAETSVRLGLTGGYGAYAESVAPQDTEGGGLVGGSVSASALMPSAFGNFGLPDLYTDAGYDFSAGFLRYHGNLQNAAGTPYQADDHAFYNTAIVRLGLGHPIGGSGELIPYVAGGYQNWYRNVGGPDGVGEFYQAGLIGGGLRFDVAPNPLLVLSASAEGFAVIGGTISAPSTDFSGDFGTSAEERVGLDADYRLDHSWHAFAGLGVTHYNYTGSKAGAAGAYEPLSSTLQVNSMFGVAYGF
jgi:hypothetical protein